MPFEMYSKTISSKSATLPIWGYAPYLGKFLKIVEVRKYGSEENGDIVS